MRNTLIRGGRQVGIGLVLGLIVLICCRAGAAQDRVLARVNGEAIYEHELLANMPKDQFAANTDDLQASKLERLIQEAVMRQFLQKTHIAVPEQTIDNDIADLKQNPPPAGCMCCRYKSLQEFMDVNAYTVEELRLDIRNNEGIDQYLRQLWQQKYPTREARLAYARQQREHITKMLCEALAYLFQHLPADKLQQRPGQGDEREKSAGAGRLAAPAARGIVRRRGQSRL